MAALAEDLINVFEVLEVAFREAFLVWDEQVLAGGAKPARKNALEEDVGIKFGFAREKPGEWRNRPTMRDCYFKTSRAECLVDEIYIAVEAYTIGAGDDVDFFCHDRVLGFLSWVSFLECLFVMLNGVFTHHLFGEFA